MLTENEDDDDGEGDDDAEGEGRVDLIPKTETGEIRRLG